MSVFIAFRFALVRTDEKFEVVGVQHFLGDVRPEVATTAPKRVGYRSSTDVLGIAPEEIQHLNRETGIESQYAVPMGVGGP